MRICNRNVWRQYKKTTDADVLVELQRRPQFAAACRHLLAFQRIWDYTRQYADDWNGDLAELLLHHADRGTLKK